MAQARLQADLEELFAALEKARGGAGGAGTAGALPKRDLKAALRAFFRVGAPGGKSGARFDEAWGALEGEHGGEAVEWRKVRVLLLVVVGVVGCVFASKIQD